ncbi:hypothetical protein [Lacticaseibacillus sp. GG6-2]
MPTIKQHYQMRYAALGIPMPDVPEETWPLLEQMQVLGNFQPLRIPSVDQLQRDIWFLPQDDEKLNFDNDDAKMALTSFVNWLDDTDTPGWEDDPDYDLSQVHVLSTGELLTDTDDYQDMIADGPIDPKGYYDWWLHELLGKRLPTPVDDTLFVSEYRDFKEFVTCLRENHTPYCFAPDTWERPEIHGSLWLPGFEADYYLWDGDVWPTITIQPYSN